MGKAIFVRTILEATAVIVIGLLAMHYITPNPPLVFLATTLLLSLGHSLLLVRKQHGLLQRASDLIEKQEA